MRQASAAPVTGAAAVRSRVSPTPVLPHVAPVGPAAAAASNDDPALVTALPLPLPSPSTPFALPAPPAPSAEPVSLPGGALPEEALSMRFTLLPGVTLPPGVKEKVTRIADGYFRRTGKPLVVTSGVRDAVSQADAMYDLFRLGADVDTLYRNKGALREIQRAYNAGRAASRPEGVVVAAMGEVIRRQVESGVYISAHLRSGAVDVRNRDMSLSEKRALLDAVLEVGGVTALEETRPPHYHLQVD
ncbi:Very large tegument protein [Chondromyces apiculatus DSM 436]|uniref:Very large tegument protein n=1 Tax=Chondromyces apiculatus DSM 436 TaxID=1192034 RepID=A0A017TFE5_9BACT|nr:Very large tegument protein [Chondromyces apiculatus DSM 436]